MAKISTLNARPVDVDDEDHPLDVRGLLFALLRRSWLIVLLAIAAGVAVWSLTRNTPTFYQSAAVIQIETQERTAIELRDDSQNNLQNPEVVETIIQKFRSRALMDRVNKALGLTRDRRFLGTPSTEPASDDLVIALLLGGSQASLRPRTRLIDVTFTHQDRDVARKVANSLVDEFLKQGVDQRTGTLEEQNRVLIEKSRELKEKVNRSEQAIQEYKQKTVASVSLDDRRNLVEQKLKGLNADLTNAKGERLRLESDVDQAKRSGGSTEQLLAIPSIIQDPQVIGARERLIKAEGDLSALAQRYGPLHPRMIEAKAQVEGAREDVAAAVRTAPDRIKSRYAAAKAQEDGLQRAVQDQESAMLEMDSKAIEFHALQREYDSDRTLFESVLQRLKESNLQLGVQAVEFHVVEPALAARQVPGRRPLYIAAATLAGAGLAGGILVLSFFLNQSVGSVGTAEGALKLPVFTTVPKIRASGRQAVAVAAMSRPGSREAESFRTLRTALQLLPPESRQVILITSAVPAEGKSVSAGNIAVAFAQLRLKTLLIEADLRRPSLDGLFLPASRQGSGLGDYLKGQPVSIVPTDQEHLDFLPAGHLIENPAESLASPRFGELIAKVKASHDRIIIDTAPVNVVSDTLNIVACADAVCLVVRSNATSLKLVKRAIELLKRSGVRPDGLILNWTSEWTGRKYKEYYQGGQAMDAGISTANQTSVLLPCRSRRRKLRPGPLGRRLRDAIECEHCDLCQRLSSEFRGGRRGVPAARPRISTPRTRRCGIHRALATLIT